MQAPLPIATDQLRDQFHIYTRPLWRIDVDSVFCGIIHSIATLHRTILSYNRTVEDTQRIYLGAFGQRLFVGLAIICFGSTWSRGQYNMVRRFHLPFNASRGTAYLVRCLIEMHCERAENINIGVSYRRSQIPGKLLLIFSLNNDMNEDDMYFFTDFIQTALQESEAEFIQFM